MNKLLRLFIGLSIAICSCFVWMGFARSKHPRDYTEEHRMVDTLKIDADGIFELRRDFNLNGKTYIIPEGASIRQINGVFMNGVLIGNNTNLATKTTIFNNVTILGSWNVPEISTSLFADLSYDNSLRDVLGLASPIIHNNITIEKGIYNFNFNKNDDVGIEIPANTSIRLKGELRVNPNTFESYSIVLIGGDNISISGDGCVIGDKDNHKANKGEWGMGVKFNNARNCLVDGLTIKDCWGDCIYIGKNSSDIRIENCSCINGRRQGISITSGHGIYVGNTFISNIGGTNPQCAIDIEPNNKQEVNNVLIENVEVSDCVGGFVISANIDKKNAIVSDVEYRNCKLENIGRKPPLNFKQANKVKVYGCKINKSKYDYIANIFESSHVVFANNIIDSDNKYIFERMDNVNFFNNVVHGVKVCKNISEFELNKLVIDNDITKSY